MIIMNISANPFKLNKNQVSSVEGTVEVNKGCIVFKVQSGEDCYFILLTLLFCFNLSMSI